MTDRRTVYTVVLALAITVVGGVLGSLLLASMDVETPALVSDLAKIALGALGAVLATTRVDPAQLPAPDPNAADPPASP